MNSDARIEAARARLADGRSALVVAKLAGPPCVDCAHFAKSICGHPALATVNHNRVDGSIAIENKTKAEVARSDNGLCGYEAALFEPHPLPTRALRTFNAKPYAESVYLWGGTGLILAFLALFG